MKIFFFTTSFAPNYGGIESMAEMLCDQFTDLGHDVRLATLTPGNDKFSFPVFREPNPIELLRLFLWCDVHIQANVSLKNSWLLLFGPKKFFYRHGSAYKTDSGSITFLDSVKRIIARFVPGIANSRYTAQELNIRNIVLNAYDDTVFINNIPWHNRRNSLVFLGRLVSQKGCDVLIRALGRLLRRGYSPNLTIIGEGPEKNFLRELTNFENVDSQVRFVGPLKGQELAEALNDHKIIVAPSTCEETFGIVALEGLACGCLPVVSERGGLVDAISGHGFTFPNGNDLALAELLSQIIDDPEIALARLSVADEHVSSRRMRSVAEQYIAIFENQVGSHQA